MTAASAHPFGLARTCVQFSADCFGSALVLSIGRSEEGHKEREANYGPLLEELCRRVPISPTSLDRPRVNVPGAGLGRLLVEVVSRGYHGEGNEFSFHMLTTAHVILNEIEEAESVRLCPWIHSDCNQLHPKDGLRIVEIPDETAADILDKGRRGARETKRKRRRRRNGCRSTVRVLFVD